MHVFLASTSFFFSSRRRHTRCSRDWSSDVCSSDLVLLVVGGVAFAARFVPPRTAARVAARGLRAGWDWVSSIGDETHGTAVRGPPRHLSRKAQAAAPQTDAGQRRTASREGIVPQPPKET